MHTNSVYKTHDYRLGTGVMQCSHAVLWSLYIEFDEFKGNIIMYWWLISADPQFNVISCCIGQVLCKPWRVVELTACAGGCTVLTIPENIIGVEYILITPGRV